MSINVQEDAKLRFHIVKILDQFLPKTKRKRKFKHKYFENKFNLAS